MAGVGTMVLSAIIFGVCWLLPGWTTTSGITGNTLPFMVIFVWALRVGCIGSAICAGITMGNQKLGSLLYAIVGLGTAAAFVVVAILDVMDKQHTPFAYAPILLLLFGAWNGWSAIGVLRDSTRPPADTMPA